MPESLTMDLHNAVFPSIPRSSYSITDTITGVIPNKTTNTNNNSDTTGNTNNTRRLGLSLNNEILSIPAQASTLLSLQQQDNKTSDVGGTTLLPSKYTCVIGKGKVPRKAKGNLYLKSLVQKKVDDYVNAQSKMIKSSIVTEIYDTIVEACNRCHLQQQNNNNNNNNNSSGVGLSSSSLPTPQSSSSSSSSLLVGNDNNNDNATNNAAASEAATSEAAATTATTAAVPAFVRYDSSRRCYNIVGVSIAREKITSVFRDCLSDRYKSSTKNKVAKRRIANQKEKQDQEQAQHKASALSSIRKSADKKQHTLEQHQHHYANNGASSHNDAAQQHHQSLQSQLQQLDNAHSHQYAHATHQQHHHHHIIQQDHHQRQHQLLMSLHNSNTNYNKNNIISSSSNYYNNSVVGNQNNNTNNNNNNNNSTLNYNRNNNKFGSIGHLTKLSRIETFNTMANSSDYSSYGPIDGSVFDV